jgi:hypothetical protein
VQSVCVTVTQLEVSVMHWGSCDWLQIIGGRDLKIYIP